MSATTSTCPQKASSTGPIDYLWTSTAGSFADSASPITTYRCEEAGQQDLTISILDGAGSCSADAFTVTVTCEVGQTFACTEQGVRDAIAAGGGPHTFACNGPTTVTTQAEIVIDNDVILDGEGLLTLDGNASHRVFQVLPGVSAGLRAMTVTGGMAAVDGGGIFVEDGGTLTVRDCTISENTAARNGGGIGTAGELIVMNTAVLSNTANSGGGIVSDGQLAVRDSIISDNYAVYIAGGGLLSRGADTVERTVISDNFVRERGGGILVSGSLILTQSAVTGNEVELWDGGGVYVHLGTLTVSQSTIAGNHVSRRYGGGIANNGTSMLYDSTVSGNQAVGLGGGIANWAALSLDHCTVLGNTATTGSAMFVHVDGSVVARGTIVEGTCERDGLSTSLGANVESPLDTCGFDQSSDLVDVSPQTLNLGPLADNGGPTQTHALLPGSIAIDRIPTSMCLDADGQPLTTDQRGVARPQALACDVGAFEYADCSGSACDDGNDCTADHCNPSDASWCAHTTLPDGSLCGTDGVCEAGACRE